MEILLDFWQFTLVGVLILIGYVVSLVTNKNHLPISFVAEEMPHMKPIGIPTKGKGFWGGVWTWLMVSRTWETTEDFAYQIGGKNYVIPKGFVFDGASVPKFLRSWLSPMGVLLIGGLVHDYGYKYQTLLLASQNRTSGVMTQKEMDVIFRDINIEVNGFKTINYLAYYALRLGGFAAWNGHRKRDCSWKESVDQ